MRLFTKAWLTVTLTVAALSFGGALAPAAADVGGPASCSADAAPSDNLLSYASNLVDGDGATLQLAQATNVCCSRGSRNYLTSRRACRRVGGRVVADRRCRVDTRRACCFRRNRTFFSTRGVCRRTGGRIVADRRCQVDNSRSCCVRGNRRFFSTRAACRRAGGRIAADQVCRVDNRRSCCIRGNRRFFSTRAACRRAGGRVAADRFCRAGPPQTGGRCFVGNARITVSIPGSCGARTMRLRFPFRALNHRQTYRLRANSGIIGRGRRPYGLCNFHTDIVYRCLNGRLRINRAIVCRQARSNITGASCRVTN